MGAGVWDYRLRQMWCSVVAPLPLRLGEGGGASVVIRFSVFVYPTHPPGSLGGGRLVAGPPPREDRQVYFRLVSFFTPRWLPNTSSFSTYSTLS